MEWPSLLWPEGQTESADVGGRAMKAIPVKPVRCAIYTRVSTDQGLDQEFNSLDAQYDASSAYIKSQAHAGWGDRGSCCVPADKSGQPVEPGAELFVEGRYGQQIRIPTWRRDDLQAHGQAGLVEARRNADRGRARKGRPYNDLHPAMVAVHRAASDLGRPTGLHREGKYLRGGQ